MNEIKFGKQFTTNNEDDISTQLKLLSKDIEENGNIKTAFIVLETKDGYIDRYTLGEPCDRARALGVLIMSIAQASVS